MEYVGIDWAYRRAAWCAVREGGVIVDEGFVPADADGLAKLVLGRGPEVRACVEMMSGAIWVRDQLRTAGWEVEVADARKVKGLAPLACKTDKVDARVLAELSRRELVPAVWLPSLDDRELRERLKRRMHLVRMRTMARNRIHGVLTQWGLKLPVARLRGPDAVQVLEARGVPEVWRRSVGRGPRGDRLARRAPSAAGTRVGAARPRRRPRRVAGNDPRHRTAARADDRD